MTYSKLIELLQAHAEVEFANFQRKLIFTKQHILGVRTPTLRKIAKEFKGKEEEVFAFPDEFYEVTFIKLAVISALPYGKFLLYVKDCVKKIDNWATCDTFKANCIQTHKEDFLPVLKELFANDEEFFQRYVIVTLLSFYVEKKYLKVIESYMYRANLNNYYVHMAVAWLIAEILIKEYEFGVKLLEKGNIPQKTHNKGIQKAVESYRLTKEQKDFLKSLKK